MVNLSFVKPKNKLKSKAFKSELVNEIIKRMSEFENHATLRSDPECELVENGVKDKINEKEFMYGRSRCDGGAESWQ